MQKIINIKKKNLPLYCPNIKFKEIHPKVFLNIKTDTICPYCGTKYVLSEN